MPPGLVSSLIPRRRGTSRVILDYGWTDDGKIRVLYKLSKAVIFSGAVNIPSSMKQFIQETFVLKTTEGARIGVLTVKSGSARGLRPFFIRRGGDPGDYLLGLFDLAAREAEIQIGDADLIDSLETAEREAIGFHWDEKGRSIRSHSWDTRFQQLVEFKNRHGHCNILWSTDRPLALWASRQRSARRVGKLEAGCVRRLEEIGFPWGSTRTSRRYERGSWEARFQRLAEFKNKNGHCNMPRAVDRVLWGWAVRQRRAKRIGKLDADRVHRLEQIGFQWETAGTSRRGFTGQQCSWEARFQQLVEFKTRYGHCNVPRAAEKSLGQWVSNQRHARKVSKLDANRIRRLEEIGFQWKVTRNCRSDSGTAVGSSQV